MTPPTVDMLAAVSSEAAASREHRAELERLICDAAKAGATTRQIAAAAGLSHQRIHQIIHGR